MKLSVIIPCHPSNRPSLPRTLRSLERASSHLDVETLVVEDEQGRGPSWARNSGLDRARGDFIFFCDADDEVRPDFFAHPAAALERTGADFCLFGFNDFRPRRTYDLVGNASVKSTFLPTVFGYSFEDIRRWNAGGRLWDSREWAMVWRAAYRRDFLEKHRIRFDEDVRFCEDAMFLSLCGFHAGRMCSVDESLYDYRQEPTGLLSRGLRSAERWKYKFQMLDFRKRLAASAPSVLDLAAGSAALSTLELLKAHQDWRRYLSDSIVTQAVRAFPISWRHPLVATGIVGLRSLAGFRLFRPLRRAYGLFSPVTVELVPKF